MGTKKDATHTDAPDGFTKLRVAAVEHGGYAVTRRIPWREGSSPAPHPNIVIEHPVAAFSTKAELLAWLGNNLR